MTSINTTQVSTLTRNVYIQKKYCLTKHRTDTYEIDTNCTDVALSISVILDITIVFNLAELIWIYLATLIKNYMETIKWSTLRELKN